VTIFYFLQFFEDDFRVVFNTFFTTGGLDFYIFNFNMFL